MPDIKYPKNSNSDTVFVEDGAQRTRAVKTVQPDGTIDYPTNPNSDSCYVTVDGEKQRALMVADISSAGTIEYPTNPNSTKGYVNINGTKQRVSFTANIAGGGSAPVIDELNVTPSTSTQVITAPTGTDGYSPVNVSAVDASIDANITAGNIKSGVTILGVTGNVVELNGETVSVTPTTSSQTITPTSPKNAITEVSVSAVTSSIDANIQAGNIKKDVTILGVTGSYEGGGGGSGLALELEVSGGKLQHSTTASSIIDLTGVTSLEYYVLNRAYQNNTAISGNFSFDVDTIQDYAMQNIFRNSSLDGAVHITVSTSCVTNGLYGAFSNSKITSIEIGGALNGGSCVYELAKDCTYLTSAKFLPNTTIGSSSSSSSCGQKMFMGCSLLANVDASGITTIGGSSSTSSSSGYNMFASCPLITTMTFTNLTTLYRNCCYKMFENCTNLASLYFPAITTTSFSGAVNQFNSMLVGVDNCTLHFPSNVQSVIEGLTGYSTTAPFGATAGTVLFDLPATS